MRPVAVVFDLDGTLIDSEETILDAVSTAFASIAIDVRPGAIASHFGAPLEELFAHFAGAGADDARFSMFAAAYRDAYDDHPRAKAPAFPGVEETLRALVARGYRLGVATTKPTLRAQSQLDAIGVANWFAHIQGTDAPLKPKPAPDVVLAACAALQVAPSRAWYVGDTARDVDAARNAGCRPVLIGKPVGRVALRLDTFAALAAALPSEGA